MIKTYPILAVSAPFRWVEMKKLSDLASAETALTAGQRAPVAKRKSNAPAPHVWENTASSTMTGAPRRCAIGVIPVGGGALGTKAEGAEVYSNILRQASENTRI